jgi:hypothetical protein
MSFFAFWLFAPMIFGHLSVEGPNDRIAVGRVMPIAMNCNDDALAICLKKIDSDFQECEQGCQSEFPGDSGGYADCRDGCRIQHESDHNECYEENCQSSFNENSLVAMCQAPQKPRPEQPSAN